MPGRPGIAGMPERPSAGAGDWHTPPNGPRGTRIFGALVEPWRKSSWLMSRAPASRAVSGRSFQRASIVLRIDVWSYSPEATCPRRA